MTLKCVLMVNIYLMATVKFTLSSEHNVDNLELGGNITRIVHDESFNIYVGGANFIAQISNKFQIEHFNLSIGPVLENWNCRPRPAPCDNVVHVLQVIQELGLLLVCGSAYNGTCTLHRLNDLTSWTCLVNDDGDHIAQTVAGHEDKIVITQLVNSYPGNSMLEFENHVDTCRPNNFCQNSLLQSSRYEEHKLNGNTTQRSNDQEDTIRARLMVAGYLQSSYNVSIRHITYEDLKFNIKFEFYKNSNPSNIRMAEASQCEVNFKMSFLWKQFLYYVTVETSRNSSGITKLNRVPMNSSQIFQLVHLRLQCKHNSTVYNIVTSIALAKVGILSSKGYETVEGLIAAFGSIPNNSSMSTQKDRINVLCAFPLADIDSFIAQELSLQNDPNEVNISLTEPHENQALFAFNTSVINLFTYTATEGERRMDSVDVFMIDANSHVNKIGLKAIYKQSKPQFENTSHITMILKLDYVFSKWKQHQLGFLDQSKALIYIAHENKVLQIKTSKCQMFVTCNQCNTNMCRWCPLEKMCVDKLYGEKICNATSDHYCPPMIESIQPKEIPKEGGTLLYLNGSNFGNDSSKISVTVCNRSCHNITVEDRHVTCTTGPVCGTSSPEMCHVQLTKTADDTKNENFATPSDKDSQLHCVTPQISSYSPQYGPVSGGIQVQFTGKHLLAGNNVTINVAGRNCGSIQRNGSKLSCQIMKSSFNTTMCGNVTIKIDNFMKEKKERFCYRPNPEVKNVHPLTSLMSGGTFLNISGSFINSIKVPQFAINITNVLNNTYDIFTEACKEPNSNNTLCRTPNTSKSILSLFKRNTSMEYINATVSLCSGDNCFTLEGNEQLKIYRDPVFRLSLEENTEKLRLKGKYIPEWLQNHECNISVGRFHCPVTKVDKLYIECDVSQIIDQQKQQNSGTKLSLKDAKTKELAASNTPANTQINLTVTVTIGNYEEIVGVVSLEKTASNGNTTPLYISLIGGVIAGLVFVFVILLIVTINIRQRRKKLRKRPFYLYGSKIDLQMQPLKEILTSIGDQVKNEDFDKLIIDLDKLTIGKPLGSGNFGCVYEGILQESRDQQPKKVAVKTLKDPKSHNIDLAAFIQEALIMKNFQHSNVLELVGLTEKEPGVPYVILPYMDNGDLLTYVRNTSVNLSLHDVIKFGADIASGMAYLSSLKFVHRDLAARNCMLDSSLTVKVADFGLCRDIYEKGYYSSDNKKVLPVRWMAIECIDSGSYTTKSDVWSLGVVLWELLTRGMTPYPGVDGWDIINYLRHRRLAMPFFCPDRLYYLMMLCWAKDPKVRPSFSVIEKELLRMIKEESPQSLQCSTKLSRGDITGFHESEGVLESLQETITSNETVQPKDNNSSEPQSFGCNKSVTVTTDIELIELSNKTISEGNYIKLSESSCPEVDSERNENHYINILSVRYKGLVNNVGITQPACYSDREVSREEAGVYVHLVDHYQTIPNFKRLEMVHNEKSPDTDNKQEFQTGISEDERLKSAVNNDLSYFELEPSRRSSASIDEEIVQVHFQVV